MTRLLGRTKPSTGPHAARGLYIASLNNEYYNRLPTQEGYVQRQCTCKVLAENSVDSADYYITKVVLELPSKV